MSRSRALCISVLLATSALTPALAQNSTGSGTVALPTIDVEGQYDGHANLDVKNTTGSKLGLTPRETPATVNIVTQKDIEEKVLRSLIETYNSVPGVVSGNLPGEPGVVSIRGFSRATGYSVDGTRSPDPLITSRDYDTFNFERVEILKGPASVVSGTGALAGTINLVTKQPKLGQTSTEGLLGYGSFNTLRTGVGVNAPIGSAAAVRSTVSYSKSDGHVNDTKSEKYAITNNVLFAPTDRLTLSGAVNYFHDDFRSPYQGIPLVPASIAHDATSLVSTTNGMVIDRSMRNINYNVNNGLMKSDALWLRGNADYKVTNDWTFKNELNFYKADRDWASSEDFTYNAGTGLLDRSTTKITHDHQFWSDRAAMAYDGPLGGLRNRFTAGLEYIDAIFGSQRRFGTATSVNPFDPVRGYFPADTSANFSTRQNFASTVKTTAAFAENAINLTPAWIVVGGARYERIALNRRIDDLNTGAVTTFDKAFYSPTWRIGSVYEIVNGTSVYAQYTKAAIPITTLLLSSMTNSQFELSTGRSVEAGVKSSLWNGRVVATAAVYQIDQDNILTRDPVTPSLTVQGGSQRSRGFEIDAALAVTDRWTVTPAFSAVDAYYTSLRNATRDLSGNRPINVPARTLSLSSSYRLESVPATVGVVVHNVSSFYTDATNLIEVQGRTLLDAWIAYEVSKGTLRLRGRNLTNAFYADWSGYSSTQVYLGAPRSFDLSYNLKW